MDPIKGLDGRAREKLFLPIIVLNLPIYYTRVITKAKQIRMMFLVEGNPV